MDELREKLCKNLKNFTEELKKESSIVWQRFKTSGLKCEELAYDHIIIPKVNRTSS